VMLRNADTRLLTAQQVQELKTVFSGY